MAIVGRRMIRRLELNKSEKEPIIPMPHTMRLALANGAPCSGSANTIETLAAAAVAPVVWMNDEERQVGCRVCVLLMDLCVEGGRLLGGTSVDGLM